MMSDIISHALVLFMFSATGMALGWAGNARMRELATRNTGSYLLWLFGGSMVFSVLLSAVLFAQILPITTWGGAIFTSMIVAAVVGLVLPLRGRT